MTPEQAGKIDKKEIEPTLLKHIIEAQREYLKPDLTDEQRRTNAKWYLINSTPSYRGLINGINELVIAGRSKGIEEAEYWKARCEAAEQVIIYEQPQFSEYLSEWRKFKQKKINSDMQTNGASQPKPNSSTDDGNQITNP